MKGRVFETQEELEAEGWKYAFTLKFMNLLNFKKDDDKRIGWNPITKCVEIEYNTSIPIKNQPASQ